MHKTPKKAEIAELYAHFAAAAAQHGVTAFEIVPKRGNLTSENFEWSHERFSRKKVLAATLSAHAAPHALDIANASLFGSGGAPSAAVLARNIRVVVDAISKHIYAGAANSNGNGNGRAVSEKLVAQWLRQLVAQPRVDAFLAHGTGKSKAAASGMHWSDEFNHQRPQIVHHL